MTASRALVLVVLAAWVSCDKRHEDAARPPVGSGTAGAGTGAAPLPDVTTIDWGNLRYTLGSLGSVQASHGRAEFRVIDDDDGTTHATQEGSNKSDPRSLLELGDPVYGDLDGDHFDEALIPFVLSSDGDAPTVHGAFVFTLREGTVVKLDTLRTPTPQTFAIKTATIEASSGAAWTWDAKTHRLVPRR